MATNISNLPISSSFQDLVLESGSILQNATGSIINNLTITSSFAISASHATNVPVTASHALTAVSASFATSASYAVSASVEITKEVSSSFADVAAFAQSVNGGDVNGAVASASFAETASLLLGSVESASFASSASVATLADSASNATRAVSASMADSASYAVLADDSRDLIIGVKSSQATTILKGQVLRATGVTGENINVVTASNASSATMPAIGVAASNINVGASGTAVIAGRLIGVNTDGLTAGRNVYVNGNGGFTGTKPTGSALIQNIAVVGKVDAVDGEIVVIGSGRSNDLPNITSGYAWVGNENQVPTAVSTASFNAGSASFAESASVATLAQTASNAINAITASHTAGTASFADNASSASVAARATTLSSDATASFADRATSASIANELSQLATASFAITASHALNVPATASHALTAVSASQAENADSASNALRAITASIADDIKTGIDVSFRSGSFDNLTATSASIGFLESITGSAKIIGDAFIILNNNTPTERFAGIIVQDSGSVNTSASIQWDGESHDWKYSYNVGAGHESAVALFGPEASEITDTRYPEDNYILKGTGTHHLASSSIVDNASTVTIGNTTTFSNGASGSFSGSFEGNGSEITGIVSASHAESASVATTADTAITASHIVTASFADRATSASIADLASTLSPTATASFADSATSASQADNASSASNAINAITASNVNTLNQDVQITGSVFVSGSVQGRTDQLVISSTTASFDPNEANYYELTLAGGADTHVTVTSVPKSHTMNLMVKQGGTTGTLSWNTNYFKFPGGTQFTGSQVTDTQDILSFVSFASSSVYYGTAISDVK